MENEEFKQTQDSSGSPLNGGLCTYNKCPSCDEITLKHYHRSAHGIPGTHMSGSERYICDCGFWIANKEKAASHGLKFYFDV